MTGFVKYVPVFRFFPDIVDARRHIFPAYARNNGTTVPEGRRDGFCCVPGVFRLSGTPEHVEIIAIRVPPREGDVRVHKPIIHR